MFGQSVKTQVENALRGKQRFRSDVGRRSNGRTDTDEHEAGQQAEQAAHHRFLIMENVADRMPAIHAGEPLNE